MSPGQRASHVPDVEPVMVGPHRHNFPAVRPAYPYPWVPHKISHSVASIEDGL